MCDASGQAACVLYRVCVAYIRRVLAAFTCDLYWCYFPEDWRRDVDLPIHKSGRRLFMLKCSDVTRYFKSGLVAAVWLVTLIELL